MRCYAVGVIEAGAEGFSYRDAPALTIILTAAMLNLRHTLYSASIAYMRSFSRGWKLIRAGPLFSCLNV
jgi:predicted branched-subunit amino acid permease